MDGWSDGAMDVSQIKADFGISLHLVSPLRTDGEMGLAKVINCCKIKDVLYKLSSVLYFSDQAGGCESLTKTTLSNPEGI